jgi:hypothetical protein
MTESTKNGDYGIKGHRKSPFGVYFIFARFVLSTIQKLYNLKESEERSLRTNPSNPLKSLVPEAGLEPARS